MNDSNNTRDSEENISKRLDAIISILLNQKKINEFNQTEQIRFLTKIGFKNNEISNVLGITLENVKASKYRKNSKKNE